MKNHLLRILPALACVLLIGGPGSGPLPAQTHPEPSIIVEAWEFEIEFGAPRVTPVRTIDGNLQYYWYLPYTVTNNTGEDRLFVPRFDVLTNEGDLISAGRKVDPGVFDAVKLEQQNDLLESPVHVIGRLLQGEDNARDSVTIWPAPAKDVDRMWVFISGLSGETTTIAHPTTGEKIILRKTLMLEIETPGTLPALSKKPVQIISKKWIMR